MDKTIYEQVIKIAKKHNVKIISAEEFESRRKFLKIIRSGKICDLAFL